MLTKLIFFSTILLSTSFDTCFFHEILQQTEVPSILVQSPQLKIMWILLI
jgi:hypothetical protein